MGRGSRCSWSPTASLGRFVRTIRAEAWLPAVVVLAGSVLMFALAEPNELTDDPAAEHDRLGSTWAAVCGSRSVPRHRRADPGVLASVVFQPFSLAVAEWLACQPTSTIGKALAKPFYGVQRWRRGPLRAQAVGPSVAELRRGPPRRRPLRPLSSANAIRSTRSTSAPRCSATRSLCGRDPCWRSLRFSRGRTWQVLDRCPSREGARSHGARARPDRGIDRTRHGVRVRHGRGRGAPRR